MQILISNKGLTKRFFNELKVKATSILVGIAFAEGSLWSEQRRFALHTLRDLGFGKRAFEDTIRDELRDLLSFFEQQSKPVNPKTGLTRSVGNVICALVFGQRMGGVDKEYDAAANLITNSIVRSVHPLVLFTARCLRLQWPHNAELLCSSVLFISVY